MTAMTTHRIARSARPALLALAAALAACGGGEARPPLAVPVAVARAATRDVPYTIEATGTVEPLQTVAVEPQVTGIVTRVAFHEGDEVQKGQLLFQIDPRPFAAALAEAEAQLHRDSAQAAQAARDAARYAVLVKQDYVTEQQYETQQSTAASLAAAVRADSAAVQTARLNLDYAAIRAPIAGRTGSLLVREGNLARTNSATPLVVINQIRPILARFAVPQAALPQIQRFRGETLRVTVSPAQGDTAGAVGVLSFVDNAVDTSTGTVLLKARFANDDRSLWPGEFVYARLTLYTEKGATVVPAPALTTGQTGTFVFVVNADMTVTMRPVTVERVAGPVAVIASGVKPGDEVVTDGQVRLATGSKVEIKSGPGAASAGDVRAQ